MGEQLRDLREHAATYAAAVATHLDKARVQQDARTNCVEDARNDARYGLVRRIRIPNGQARGYPDGRGEAIRLGERLGV